MAMTAIVYALLDYRIHEPWTKSPSIFFYLFHCYSRKTINLTNIIVVVVVIIDGHSDWILNIFFVCFCFILLSGFFMFRPEERGRSRSKIYRPARELENIQKQSINWCASPTAHHRHRTNIVAARVRPNRCIFAKQYQSPVVFVFSLLRHRLPSSDIPMVTIFFFITISVFIRFRSYARCKIIIIPRHGGGPEEQQQQKKNKQINVKHNITRVFNTDSGAIISGYLFASRIS